jgi:solute carrier family 50 protein (sugar transporter)
MVAHVLNIVRNVVGILGNAISLFLFLSPLPTFVEIRKKKSVEQYSPAPYLATLMNCLVWVLYGMPMVKPNSVLVYTINGAGVVIELVYISLFVIYCSKNPKLRMKVILITLVEIVFIAVLSTIVLTVAHGTTQRSMIVGIVALLFNVMMYAAPLSVMKMVIKNKSVEFMPFFLSLASLGNGIAWTTYGFLPLDPYIAGPNGAGTLLSLAQLTLYALYYKNTQRILSERAKQVGLSEVIVSGHNTTRIGSAAIPPHDHQINGHDTSTPYPNGFRA